MVNIAWHILEQEDAERAAAAERAAREPAAQLAEVERRIEELKAYLDAEYADDPPECWPLRKQLVGLWDKRRELLGQQGVVDR